MSENPRPRNKHRPGEQYPRIDDAYVFDGTSGLYKRKSNETENARRYDYEGRFRVSVARDWVIVALNVLTLAIVFAYTYYAKRTVEIMKESEERAWVQLGDNDIELTHPPKFDHVTRVGFGMPETNGTGMEVDFPLTINNVGTRIAKRYSVWAELVADTERHPENVPWGEWWKSVCSSASGNMQARGHPLLPGITHTTETAMIFFVPEQSQYIRSVYIVTCVTYREMNGDDHFTAITYCPSTFDEHPVKVLDNPEMFYDLKQTKFWACNHEAD
jgi:hypothetical protein